MAVTGPLGSPAAGFIALDHGIDAQEARESLYVPIPKVAEGVALASCGAVTSCMDLSDGLATALNTICSASGVGIDIEYDFLPRGACVEEIAEATGSSMEDMLIGWGGEYELVFTADKDRLDDAEVEFSIIGIVNDGDGLDLIREGERKRIGYGRY